MTKIHLGERISRSGSLRIGCSAVIFDDSRQKILLTRRADNGQWCLPGGAMEPGETAIEACQREILEETGLRIRVGRLIGVYSNPDVLVEYADGNCFQIVVLNFEAIAIGGELRLSNETTDFGYFALSEIEKMDLISHHKARIADALAGQAEAFVK